MSDKKDLPTLLVDDRIVKFVDDFLSINRNYDLSTETPEVKGYRTEIIYATLLAVETHTEKFHYQITKNHELPN